MSGRTGRDRRGQRDLTLADRIFLKGSTVLYTEDIAPHLKVYVRETDMVLKISYPGDVHYHPLKNGELERLSEAIDRYFAKRAQDEEPWR